MRESLTIEEKIEGIKHTIDLLESNKIEFICAGLSSYLYNKIGYCKGFDGVLNYFPELVQNKPKVTPTDDGYVWYPLDKEGMEERVNVLRITLSQIEPCQTQ